MGSIPAMAVCSFILVHLQGCVADIPWSDQGWSIREHQRQVNSTAMARAARKSGFRPVRDEGIMGSDGALGFVEDPANPGHQLQKALLPYWGSFLVAQRKDGLDSQPDWEKVWIPPTGYDINRDAYTYWRCGFYYGPMTFISSIVTLSPQPALRRCQPVGDKLVAPSDIDDNAMIADDIARIKERGEPLHIGIGDPSGRGDDQFVPNKPSGFHVGQQVYLGGEPYSIVRLLDRDFYGSRYYFAEIAGKDGGRLGVRVDKLQDKADNR